MPAIAGNHTFVASDQWCVLVLPVSPVPPSVPSHPASLPPSPTARSRASAVSRTGSVATTSSSSPRRSMVDGPGTKLFPSRTTRVTAAPAGSRSSAISTPCIFDFPGIATDSRCPRSRSSGADSMPRSVASEGSSAIFRALASQGRVGP